MVWICIHPEQSNHACRLQLRMDVGWLPKVHHIRASIRRPIDFPYNAVGPRIRKGEYYTDHSVL